MNHCNENEVLQSKRGSVHNSHLEKIIMFVTSVGYDRHESSVSTRRLFFFILFKIFAHSVDINTITNVLYTLSQITRLCDPGTISWR